MPTTLITTIHGIGLGVMGKNLADRVPSVTKIIAMRSSRELKNDLTYPDRCKVTITDDFNRTFGGNTKPDYLNSKYLYIETSYGLSGSLQSGQKIYVPMWEQRSAQPESENASVVISVTKKTAEFLRAANRIESVYLPWPVDLAPEPRRVSSVRNILHNAGSLGGNLRKGTPQAISIFQHSGLAARGCRLIVHSWADMPPEIAKLIASKPDGIVWTNTFHDDVHKIYEGVDLLLMPTKMEGHALVALEAMSHGVPALVTNAAPINEYEDDPLYKIPVEGYAQSPLNAPYAHVNVGAGAERLRQIADLPPSTLLDKSRAVREFVEREMSWEVLGSRWSDLCA